MDILREASEEINDQKINCPKKVLHQHGQFTGLKQYFILELICKSQTESTDE
jgi:hypothetical protein